ncbi:Pkinase-domain-containing protein [Phellopilus nigrolimitatus]|nr:Pkinase-domain-containing protein [Phellopilus nigrolimitatus]
MIHGYSDPMEQDPYAYDDSTQATQATQQATQSQGIDEPEVWNEHIWGFLKPTRPDLNRYDLWKMNPSITVGRSSDNYVVLPNLKISNRHCTITWDGNETKKASVTVHDLSSNGTFINGYKLGRGRSCLLRDGSEVAFGQWSNTAHQTTDEFRFIFRLTSGGPPEVGLHAFYDVGHELGRGSFATVMRAVCRADGIPYAIKMIHRNKLKSTEDGSMQSFRREVAILKTIKHPNICAFKEVFEDDNAINLVLEFVEGGDLLDYIISNNGVSENEARRLTYQLCNAMKYIHSKDIAHRDLKPENILLTRDHPPVVKVADFGLAKAVDSMTKFRTMCGTPCYLAPEVVLRRAEDGYSHAVDSWSIGVIVFSMIANSNPFIEDGSSVIGTRFRSRYIEWNSLYEKNISEDCKNFIRLFLEEDPRQRMTCAQALNHSWLAPLAYSDAAHGAHTADTQSFASSRAEAGSFAETSFSSNPTPVPHAHAGMSSGFEHIQMEDADGAETADMSVPGAFPASQGKGRKLERHPMEVAERDASGQVQSFELISAGPVGEVAGLSGVQSNGNGKVSADTRKRKQRSRSLVEHDFDRDGDAVAEGSSDSSLTPVSEDESFAQGPAHRRNPDRRMKATSQPPQMDSPRGRGKAPAKRTRATGRHGGANADVDM